MEMCKFNNYPHATCYEDIGSIFLLSRLRPLPIRETMNPLSRPMWFHLSVAVLLPLPRSAPTTPLSLSLPSLG